MKLTKANEKVILEAAKNLIEEYSGGFHGREIGAIQELLTTLGIEIPVEDDYVFTVRVSAEQMKLASTIKNLSPSDLVNDYFENFHASDAEITLSRDDAK